MATIRVHELAKDMDIPSKDLLDKLQILGLNMKNHMSTIPSAEVNRIKNMVLNIGKPPQALPVKADTHAHKPVVTPTQVKPAQTPAQPPRPAYAQQPYQPQQRP